jgi:hypothetical protein
MQHQFQHKLKPRKVIELKSQLTRAVNTRILVANELRDIELTVQQVENCDGSKPQMLIRIKRRIFRRPKLRRSE